MGATTRKRLTAVLSVMLGAAAASEPGSAQEPELLVTADWLAARLDDPEVVVLHASTQDMRYDAGHIPGARFLDLRRLVWEGDPPWGTEMRAPYDVEAALEDAGVRDDHRHIVLYSDEALYAARAFMTLEAMGLRGRVRMLDGGLGGWREDGRPLSRERPSPPRGSVTLVPDGDLLVGAEWVLDRLDAPGVVLVDARPDDEYTGADGGMGGTVRPGHIPGARQMYWEELVESRRTPRLLPTSELRALFETAGVDGDDTVVAYCMVGLRASFTYFVARLLGYDAKLYDGSWHEWGARSDLPAVTGREPR